MIRIVTDSSCDLPDDLITHHRIEVVPLNVRFGDEELIDREQLSVEEFWQRLTSGSILPETAAPSVGRFQEAYRRLVSAGADGILTLCISGKISATCQAANIAAEQFSSGIPVRVVDSLLVSAALGLAVIETAEAAAAGAGLDEVEAVARSASARGRIYATLDTLEYLRRGGRIGGAAAFLGGLLDVKPLIAFEDGEVTAAGRVRSRKRALSTLLEHASQHRSEISRLGVVHAASPDLDDFLTQLRHIYEDEIVVARLGPVVGTHTGPGLLGLVYLVA